MAKAEFPLHQNKNPQGDYNMVNWPNGIQDRLWITNPGDINIQGTNGQATRIIHEWRPCKWKSNH